MEVGEREKEKAKEKESCKEREMEGGWEIEKLEG